jgi:hypothetical protein
MASDKRKSLAMKFEKKAPATGKKKLPGVPYDSYFYHGGPGDDTDFLANAKGQYVEVYHIPSDTSVSFKAAITSFTDSFNQEWTPTTVFGRMDSIWGYQRTQRKVDVAIDVMASTFMEAEVNLGKMSLLEQMQYPVMDGNLEDGSGHIKGSPLVKIKFLNWISKGSGVGNAKEKGLMGWISGIQFSPKLDLGTFQDGLDLYPKGYALQLSLTVIHEENLGWQLGNNDQVEPINEKFPYGTKGVTSVETNTGVGDPAELEIAASTRIPEEMTAAEERAILNPEGDGVT